MASLALMGAILVRLPRLVQREKRLLTGGRRASGSVPPDDASFCWLSSVVPVLVDSSALCCCRRVDAEAAWLGCWRAQWPKLSEWKLRAAAAVRLGCSSESCRSELPGSLRRKDPEGRRCSSSERCRS